jgi:hypothetical protein
VKCVISLGGVALSVLGVLGAPATSEATAIRIELDAPPDCATAEGFYEAVSARTERVRPVKEGETGVRVVVHLTRVGKGAHGELRVIGEHGESDARRVDGPTCTDVVEALSLTVALAVDPTARLGPPTRPATLPAPVVVPECPEPEPQPAPPAPPAPELEVRVAAHADVMGQVSPHTSFGGDLSLRVFAPWSSGSSLGLSVLYLRNDVFGSQPDAVVGSTLFELTGCPKRFGHRETFTFEPCVVGMGGWLHAEGRGVETSSEVTRSYFALGAEAIGSVPLAPHWQAEFHGGFVVPLVKRRFTVSEPPRDVGETPSVSGIVGIGVSYSF